MIKNSLNLENKSKGEYQASGGSGWCVVCRWPLVSVGNGGVWRLCQVFLDAKNGKGQIDLKLMVKGADASLTLHLGLLIVCKYTEKETIERRQK